MNPKISVQPDFLIMCDLLEDNLQLYILRKDLLVHPVNAHRFQKCCSGFSTSLENREIEDKIKREKEGEHHEEKTRVDSAEDEGEEDEKLYCFCWYPENSSECSTLQQCDNCEEWFHPACINRSQLSNENHSLFRPYIFLCR